MYVFKQNKALKINELFMLVFQLLIKITADIKNL